MKSMQLSGTKEHPTLVERDGPRPQPQAGQVLVRVHAAGITPTELMWSPTWQTKNGEKRSGAVPSHEFSGEIVGIGKGVEGLSIGQEVYGMNDWYAEGALAEDCITQPDWIAPKPRGLSHVEAATVPIGALTALQGLFGRAKLQPGERVLVHGGAGGVGMFVVQLAHTLMAHVITTVSAHNVQFVKELGADEVIDYKASRFDQQVRDVDVVFDAVGGETLERSWGVLASNGRMVTIAADSETADERTKQAFFIVEPRRPELIEVAKMLDEWDLRTMVDAAVPWLQASDAYTGKVKRKGRGKMVVTVAKDLLAS